MCRQWSRVTASTPSAGQRVQAWAYLVGVDTWPADTEASIESL